MAKKKPKFNLPDGQDAFYPSESRSPARRMEAALVASHPLLCGTCGYDTGADGDCQNPECPEFGGMRPPPAA